MRHFCESFVLKEPKRYGVAVLVSEPCEGLIEHWRDLLPCCFSGIRVHFKSLLYCSSASAFGPQGFEAREARGLQQPSRDRRMALESFAFARQHDKHSLGYVLGQRRFVDLPQSRGIDQICISCDQRGKGFLFSVDSIILQQLLVGRAHAHLFPIVPGDRKKGTEKSRLKKTAWECTVVDASRAAAPECTLSGDGACQAWNHHGTPTRNVSIGNPLTASS